MPPITPRGNDDMRGSVHYDKRAKRWFVQVYWEGDKLRIWKDPLTLEPFWSKKAALMRLDAIRVEITHGDFVPKTWFPESPMLLERYAPEWVENKDVGDRTRSGYKTAVSKYIVPLLGKKDIRRLRAADLRAFKAHLEKRLTPAGVYNHLSALRTMLRDAWRDEDIVRVPPFPKLSEKPVPEEVQYLTVDQQDAFLAAIGPRHSPIFALAMDYAMRPGEATALMKDRITDTHVKITRAFSKGQLREHTKTGPKGRREFELTAHAHDVLASVAPSFGPFVFVTETGRPYRNRDLNRIWHAAEKVVGIKIKMYNAIRHSLGCQMLDNGEDIDIVRQIYGHTRLKTTRRYARRSNPAVTAALERRRGNVVPMRRKADGG